MQNPKRLDRLCRRVNASRRAHVCAASIALGAQIYAYGAGLGMSICRNAAWLAALPMLPLSMLAAWRASKAASHGVRRESALSSALYALLALTLLLSAVFSLGMLSCLAEQTLLAQARLIIILLLALLSAALCAFCGGEGVSRLCFALRFALPLGLALTALLSVPAQINGLFPILGAGEKPLLLSAACMLGSLAPILTLMLPPQKLTQEQQTACPPPGAWFYVWRMGLGAAFAIALLLALCAANSYEMIPEILGQRLRWAFGAKPEASLVKTLLTLLQLCALLLSSAHLLACCETAVARACTALARFRVGLALSALLAGACLLLMVFFGAENVLAAAPFMCIPSLLLLLLIKRM